MKRGVKSIRRRTDREESRQGSVEKIEKMETIARTDLEHREAICNEHRQTEASTSTIRRKAACSAGSGNSQREGKILEENETNCSRRLKTSQNSTVSDDIVALVRRVSSLHPTQQAIQQQNSKQSIPLSTLYQPTRSKRT